METKNNIFKEYLAEYLKADRAGKSKILDHLHFVTKMHRKAVIRKLRAFQMKDACKEEKRGREVFYTPDVTAALKDIWQAASEICGELLHPVIREYVEILIRDKMWRHSDETTEKLFFMSQATIKRRVSGFMKIRKYRKGISTTRPSDLKVIVPIFTGPWKDEPPGSGQIDTVVHCGSSLLGDMVYSLNYTDVSLLWLVLRAQWNKGQEATKESLVYVKKTLPFPWLSAHPDTGSEFINHFVIPWCQEEQIRLTRSRPGHKNDNMYVEERNGHVIRKFVGYQRLDCHEAVTALNELYQVLGTYLNHFVPVRKCLEKIRVGSRYKRVYEKRAMTPYQRVLEHENISKEVKQKLMAEHEKLNPMVLHRKIEKLTANVYNTQKRHGKSKNQF